MFASITSKDDLLDKCKKKNKNLLAGKGKGVL